MADDATAGGFLGTAARECGRHLPFVGAVVILLFLVFMPVRVAELILTPEWSGDYSVGWVVYFFGAYVGHAVISTGFLDAWPDGEPELLDSLRPTVSISHLVVGTAALIGLADLASVTPIWLAQMMANNAPAPPMDIAARIIALVAGFLVNATFCLAIPATVDCGDNPIEALLASKSLTSSHRSSIIGAYFFLGLLWLGDSVGISIWSASLLPAQPTAGPLGPLYLLWEAISMTAICLFATYVAVLNTVIYDRLRG